MNPKIIAFYLPQFHPIKENDEWWGKGFTEWTNVRKAVPLFKGHDQPRIPADLGYYDLRDPEIREKQAQLAREAGITAFCYWHYWLGNGKRLLESIFDNVLSSGKPDFPFCLGWANHTWYAQNWGLTEEKRILIEQTYPGKDDARQHFEFLLKAFRDPRYLKIDGKPFLFLHIINQVPQEYITWFKEWTQEAGFPGLFLAGNASPKQSKEELKAKGIDAVAHDKVYNHRIYTTRNKSKWQIRKDRIVRHLRKTFLGIPKFALDYEKCYPSFVEEEDYDEFYIPELVPQWDNSPRFGLNTKSLFYNSSPDGFYRHARQLLDTVRQKPENRQIVILKSWNEWGEGNYMEPDQRFGKGYIHALRRAVNDSK